MYHCIECLVMGWNTQALHANVAKSVATIVKNHTGSMVIYGIGTPLVLERLDVHTKIYVAPYPHNHMAAVSKRG